MIISIIAAIDSHRGIGYQNKIPWHIKEDLLRFKHLTIGKTIIIGRKTYESLIEYYKKSNRPMPERKTIVISRQSHQGVNGKIFFVASVEEAIKLAKKIEPIEVLISGGASIYSQGIQYAEKLYLTIVDGQYQADSFFPEYSQFKVVKDEKKSDGKYKYTFLELVRE